MSESGSESLFAMVRRGASFATLEIAPTAARAPVKAAYFRKLAAHPPHQDPAGFRRLRAAYEALSAPGGLELAYLSARPDPDESWERFARPLTTAAIEARARLDAAEQAAALPERFFAAWAQRPWAEVASAAGGQE